MKRILLYIWLVFWCCSWSCAQVSNLVIRHLSDVTDVGQTSINDIYQDENGCMWFATREGVIRYNGNSTVRIVPLLNDTSSLISPVVTVVDGDHQGHVFMGAEMVHCYDVLTHTIQRCWPHPMEHLVCSDTMLYIATTSHVIAYHISTQTADTLAELPIDPDDRINRLNYAPGKLYVCTSKGDVLLINLTTHQSQLICHLGSCVSFAREDKNGTLWLGTWKNGLYRFDNGQLQAVDISCTFVRDIAFTADGSLWVGTQQGLYRSTDHVTLSRVQGLTNQSVWRVYADLEGTLWIGSYFGGVDYLNPVNNVYHYWPLPQIDGNTPVINSIIPISEQQYYLCSEGNGLLLYHTQTGEIQQYFSPRASNIKSSYYNPSQHLLYLGLHLNGLCSFNTQTKQYRYYQLPYSPFYQNQVIRSIIPLGDDLLCGTYNGVYRFSPQTELFTPFSDSLNRLLPMVCDLQLDQHDHLWVVGKGIAQYNFHTHQIHMYQSTLVRASEHACVVGDKLYIGTFGYGVWVSDIDQLSLHPITAIQNKFVHNMLALPNGKLLIVFTDGVVIYDPLTQYAQTYSYANGLPLHSLYNGACTLLSDQSVMLVGMSGVAVFHPDQLQIFSSAPHIVLDNMYINNVFQPCTSSVTLTDGSTLCLDVSTDRYFNRPNLRYTLSSWNNQWVELSPTASTIRLFQLPVGKHILRIEALSTENNSLLTSREFVIYQRPPFYLSIVAILLYILLLGLVAFMVAQRMKRHYQRKAEREWQQKMLMGENVINRVYQCIINNLGNENLSVDMLVSQVGVSRTKLFAIVKNQTKLTPNELILRTRLKKAAEILIDPKVALTISEIGYDVGFSSPKYFAKCFKDFYHQTPSEYRLAHQD